MILLQFALLFFLNPQPLTAAPFKGTETPQRPLIVAHRGGAGLAPENTLDAFANSLELGVEAVELDVHLSKDGVPVVIHDPSLEKTTDGKGFVENFTLGELKSFNAGVRFKGSLDTAIARDTTKDGKEIQRIPTLEEVLDLIKRRVKLQLEIKVREDGSRYPGIEGKVIEALRKHDIVNRTVLLSFDFPTLREAKEREPGLQTCALLGGRYLNAMLPRGVSAIADEMASLKVEYAGIDERRYTPALLEGLRTRGYRVGVWTVNDESRMRYFIQQGVDFITTDRPDVLMKILKSSHRN